jgi:hypothetical protein
MMFVLPAHQAIPDPTEKMVPFLVDAAPHAGQDDEVDQHTKTHDGAKDELAVLLLVEDHIGKDRQLRVVG